MRVTLKPVIKSTRPLLCYPTRKIYNEVDRYTRRDKNTVSKDDLASKEMSKPSNLLQFSKDILKTNGDIKPGEIPNALKYSRPFEMTTLDNGIRVCTEYWPGGLAAVGAIIGAGSRHETLQTSGTAHFMEHLHFKVELYHHS